MTSWMPPSRRSGRRRSASPRRPCARVSHGDADPAQRAGGARGRDQLEAERLQQRGEHRRGRLVAVAHREERARRRVGSGRPAARSALLKAVGKSGPMPITSPVERISGPSVGSAPANRWNGSTAAFTLVCSTSPSVRSIGRPRAARQAAPTRSRARGLGDERHRPRGSRVGLDHVDPADPWTANWTLISPRTPSASAIAAVWRRSSSSTLLAQRHGRDDAGRVARVHARLLDVLHDRADHGARRRRRSRRRRPRSRRRRSGRRATPAAPARRAATTSSSQMRISRPPST